jgi:TrmH family RNA methyltransferase
MIAVMQRIASRTHEIVRAFRRAAERPDGFSLLADGVHLVREADRAGLGLLVAVTDRHYRSDTEAGALARELEARDVDVYVVTEPVMAAMSPVKTPSGIAALLARDNPFPPEVLDDPHALIVAPAGVQDPGNVGAIVRAAEALGATAAWVCGGSANPFGPKALRGSMGSAFRLPVGWGETAEQVLARAREHRLQAVAAVPRGGREPAAIAWTTPTVLFVGGEGAGVPQHVASAADARVTIPLAPPVESLNVAVASALLLDEARRQRNGVRPHVRSEVNDGA